MYYFSHSPNAHLLSLKYYSLRAYYTQTLESKITIEQYPKVFLTHTRLNFITVLPAPRVRHDRPLSPYG